MHLTLAKDPEDCRSAKDSVCCPSFMTNENPARPMIGWRGRFGGNGSFSVSVTRTKLALVYDVFGLPASAGTSQ
jgi:hypothetical protein